MPEVEKDQETQRTERETKQKEVETPDNDT